MATDTWPPNIEAAAAEYDLPVRVDAADLMDVPDGLVRAGDELHNPDNWKTCPDCRVGCPVTSTSCFKCGADFPEETVREPVRNRGPVVGICERCGHEIHAIEADGVGPLTGHGCAEGFRNHPDGEGIRLTTDADPWGDG